MAPSALLLEVVAVMCESVLVGAYGMLTALIIWLLITKRQMPKIHRYLFGASVVMFVISVVHLALVVQQSVSRKPIKANMQAKIVLSVFQFSIGDLILIWRVWVIWGRNYWIVFPPFAIMIAAAGLTFNSATLHEFRSFFKVAPSALIVANTSICTLLIVARIWYSRYQLRILSKNALLASHRFTGTVALFIESGVLYALIQIISLILDRVNSNGIHIVLVMEIPLIGILPTLIIVFVHFELVESVSRQQSNINSVPRSHNLQLRGVGSEVNLDNNISSNMKTKAIPITGVNEPKAGIHTPQHSSMA